MVFDTTNNKAIINYDETGFPALGERLYYPYTRDGNVVTIDVNGTEHIVTIISNFRISYNDKEYRQKDLSGGLPEETYDPVWWE